ncbi:hypothetical protein [Nannocystis sp. SCPEA4]|uniref:hypothetical protein n=1 Tax=Nannocystis sp. SCPEA4 TaxID=2996787 RepID=UPI002271C8E0|nr:hypothetical protein [Nannocystis sp. SCPEA4]MCY1058113.1 hypothetical protein [Nannocystis sp. SCPEA4]
MLAVAMLLGCGAAEPDAETDASTGAGSTTTTAEPKSGEPCEVEGERRCSPSGSGVLVCETGEWDGRSCLIVCRAAKQCPLGCLIAADGEDCVCVPADVDPC